MKANERSRTAEAAAALRALHALHHDDPKVFDDPWAILLIGEAWRQIISNRWAYRALNWATILDWTGELVGEVVGRQRFAEDCLAAHREAGGGQVVVLGAGLDSLALRLADSDAGLTIFEVDHPATQAWKRARIESIPGARSSAILVPVDFERDSLETALLSAGFSGDRPAFFLWLGVTYYLTESAVLDTFRALARMCAPGSEIVFDYADARLHEQFEHTPAVQRLKAFTKSRGEELISAFDQQELAAALSVRGLSFVESLSPSDQRQRYFAGRTDGVAPLSVVRFGRVRVD